MGQKPKDGAAYLADGCGRCKLGGTPDCKVHTWHDALALLRQIALDAGLTEEIKWHHPCYTHNGKNVLLIHAFKEYCGMSFFGGALLKDPEGILIQPTENTQAGRQLRITDAKQVKKLKKTLAAYIQEAIQLSESGKKVAYKKTTEYEMPEELLTRFEENPELKAAFEALTPGRQRGYLLHFSSAKQSKTRLSRIDKATDAIFAGKGHNER